MEIVNNGLLIVIDMHWELSGLTSLAVYRYTRLVLKAPTFGQLWKTLIILCFIYGRRQLQLSIGMINRVCRCLKPGGQ